MSKHGWPLAALVAAVSLAVAGTAVAGPPETGSEPGTFCGIEGTWTFRTNVDRFMLIGDGFIAHFSGYGRFTSDATGEWFEFASTGTDKFVGLVDNGDGTYSVVLEHSGSGIRLLTSSGLVALIPKLMSICSRVATASAGGRRRPTAATSAPTSSSRH